MDKKAFILITSTFALLLSWRFFGSFFPSDKIDLFLFYDLVQSPVWYVFYTSNYLNFILLSVVIHLLAKKHYPKLKTLSLFLIIISILRLIIYWLFRGSICLDVLIGSVLVYSVIKLLTWQKSQ